MASIPLIPNLHVEGVDDRSVISDLLARHGVATNRGSRLLYIQTQRNDDGVLLAMADAIKLSTDCPVGFVLDIDLKTSSRWDAVCAKIREAGATPPAVCPKEGFLGQLEYYPFQFGVWMMPDCATDFGKMEHLMETLIPSGDHLWPYAKSCVEGAVRLVDGLNATITDPEKKCKRFRDVDRKKAEIHNWLSIQTDPGVPLGGAIQRKIFGHDSPMAIAFLRWIRALYGFQQLAHI